MDFEWRRAKSPAWLDKPQSSAQPAPAVSQPSAVDALSPSASPSQKSLDGAAGGRGGQQAESASHSSAAHASPGTAAPDNVGNGQALDTYKVSGVVCRAIPIDFEQTRVEGPRSMDGWRIVLGTGTSGTCFRSASSSAIPTRAEQWRKNAIVNLFHCPILHRGRTVLNVVRHGVVGFKGDTTAHITAHLDLTLRHVVREQCKAGLPLRVVSINLLSHYKATGEPEMMERQLSSFQEVIRRINGKRLGSESDGLPKGLPVVQYAQLLLPGNTDQWEMGADYNRRKNIECKLLYLQWVCDDAVFALKRLLVKGACSESGPAGPGGVHAASIQGGVSAHLHWPPLSKQLSDAVRGRMIAGGAADKTAIIDSICWGDLPIDVHFKQILLLPIVGAPDGEVWDTLIRHLPEYLRKRLDAQVRAARLDLELSGPDTRSVEVVRSTVVLIRHILHMLSTLLGLVHQRATTLSASSTRVPPQSSPVTPGTPVPTGSAGADGDADGPAPSVDALPASDPMTPTQTNVPGSRYDESKGEGEEQADDDGLGGRGGGQGTCETGISVQLTQHVSELERARMSVNLLRTLVQAELGMWEGGYLAFASDSKHEDLPGSDDKTQEKRRRFSRSLSLALSLFFFPFRARVLTSYTTAL